MDIFCNITIGLVLRVLIFTLLSFELSQSSCGSEKGRENVHFNALNFCSTTCTTCEPSCYSPDTFLLQNAGSLLDVVLYNITADPTEHEDLSEKLPDVVNALKERVQYYMKGAVPPLNKLPDPKAVIKAKLEGIWTPWQD